uniref:RNA helicase n=1 Tax=Saccoglossus kowalevskii TaxID=10224 RepID=A0ABM0LV29_SACKO|nr:PREDICTED: LOW QUALITY PROTEIN: putative helicase Mov10l1-like [Saccoglossus kowalevskii]
MTSRERASLSLVRENKNTSGYLRSVSQYMVKAVKSDIMFSAVNKLVGFLTKNEFCREQDQGDVETEVRNDFETVWPVYYAGTGKKEENMSVGSSPLKNVKMDDLSSSDETKTYFTGKVTHLHSGYGLVDNAVYFGYDTIIGGCRPQVGTNVHVTAIRDHSAGGWKACSIMPSSDWDCTERKTSLEPVASTVIGLITKTFKNTGIINDTVTFTFDALMPGYHACPMDWVQCETNTDEATLKVSAVSVKPLREKSFEGEITSLYHNSGIIEGDIYFSVSACPRHFYPRKGDIVEGQAIESKQNNASWRAVYVNPKKKSENNRDVYKNQSPHKLYKNDLFSNKYDVSVTENLSLGKLIEGQEKCVTVWIRNHGLTTHILSGCSVCSKDRQLVFEIPSKESRSQRYRNLNTNIYPQTPIYVKIICKASNLGENSQLIVFDFGKFVIGRYVKFEVEDPEQKILMVKAPYQKSNRYERFRQSQGMGMQSEKWIIPELRDCLLQRNDITTIRPELAEPLSMTNYIGYFTTMLHLEEIQMEIDIRQFDIEMVSMMPHGEYLALTVPGLAEGRPSVLIGDKVILSVPNNNDYATPQYEGFVHDVFQEELLLKFHPEFHQTYKGEEYNVMFTFNRTSLRRCHQALEAVKYLGESVLFPTLLETKLPQCSVFKRHNGDADTKPIKKSPEDIQSFGQDLCKSKQQCGASSKFKSGTKMESDIKQAIEIAKRRQFITPVFKCNPRKKVGHGFRSKTSLFFNPSLNDCQKAAVTRILQGQSRPTPYVLYGPPGTGKTVTVVEAILQVFHNMSSSRILACTPSNSAADLLTQRLHHSGAVLISDMVRLNAFQRAEESIEDVIKPYCTNGDKLDLVCHHRIVVCTCIMAGILYQLGLKSGHFTHVFVDEAGQATEPECIIPLGMAAGQNGQIVLSGDPLQLGPVLMNKLSIKYGFNISLLERLTQRLLYNRDEDKFKDHGNYDPLLVTKLVENYRSHPALLKLSSKIFYHDELIAQADEKKTDCLCQWESLTNKNSFPILFHGLKGEDLREGDSPSWFNPIEAVQVVKYLQALKTNDVHPLEFSDIGVITPYRKQVRSNQSFMNFDAQHHIGFLSNPKRFNVAITRAQALLIIIGNPYVLVKDLFWVRLLQYCVDNNAYIGCDLPGLDEVLSMEILRKDHADDIEHSTHTERTCIEFAQAAAAEESEESNQEKKNKDFINLSDINGTSRDFTCSSDSSSLTGDLSSEINSEDFNSSEFEIEPFSSDDESEDDGESGEGENKDAVYGFNKSYSTCSSVNAFDEKDVLAKTETGDALQLKQNCGLRMELNHAFVPDSMTPIDNNVTIIHDAKQDRIGKSKGSLPRNIGTEELVISATKEAKNSTSLTKTSNTFTVCDTAKSTETKITVENYCVKSPLASTMPFPPRGLGRGLSLKDIPLSNDKSSDVGLQTYASVSKNTYTQPHCRTGHGRGTLSNTVPSKPTMAVAAPNVLSSFCDSTYETDRRKTGGCSPEKKFTQREEYECCSADSFTPNAVDPLAHIDVIIESSYEESSSDSDD